MADTVKLWRFTVPVTVDVQQDMVRDRAAAFRIAYSCVIERLALAAEPLAIRDVGVREAAVTWEEVTAEREDADAP